MDTGSKSKTISETLRAEILRGKFDSTQRLPSEHQLMRRFAAARETVRSALRDLLDKQLVDKRPGYGTFLADRAASRAALKFAVIAPDAYHPFYDRIVRGIEAGAKRHGWTTLCAALGPGPMAARAVKAAEFAELFVRERVSGAFFQPLQFLADSEKFNRAILSVFDRAKTPVVLLDSDFLPPPQRSAYDLVSVDNTNIGYRLAQHVIAAGARRIVYFSNPLPAPTSLKRGQGVGIAVAEAGLKWTREHILFADPDDARAARRFFAGRNRPDAIVAVNDYVAARLLKTLNVIGVKVPDEVLLAGVNGDRESEEAEPPITTAIQPCDRLGEAAVELMMQRLASPERAPREVFIAAEVIVRASTRRDAGNGKGRPAAVRRNGGTK